MPPFFVLKVYRSGVPATDFAKPFRSKSSRNSSHLSGENTYRQSGERRI